MLSAQQRSKFLRECLERTNEHRLRHGVPVLTLNSKISSTAQDWADRLLMSNTLSHNPRARYLNTSLGENVAYNFKSGSEVRGSEMIDQWYNEINDYNFNTHSGRKVTGHFTQLVWKNSKEVGFGLSASNGHHYLVANYHPPGNFVGQNRENVIPPQDGRMKASATGGGDFRANKSTPITTIHTESSTPQKVPTKQSNYNEIKFTINDRNFETRPQINADSKKYREIPNEGTKTFTIEPTSNPVRAANAPGKLETLKQNFLDFTDRFSASVGLRDSKGPCIESKSFKYTSNYSKPAPNTLIVTETFHEPGSRVTSTRNIVTNYDEKPTVQKFHAVRTVRETEPSKTSQGSFHFASSSSSSAAAAVTNRQTQRDFEDEVLSGHNKYRRRHRVNDLIINGSISRIAQQWADELARDEDLKLSGSKYFGQQLGESVAYKFSSIPIDYTGSELVENWYKEKDNYHFNFPNERFNMDEIGHFTQMVWRDSREIGIGKSFSKDGRKVFVVCNYFPVGNVTGCFKENVLP